MPINQLLNKSISVEEQLALAICAAEENEITQKIFSVYMSADFLEAFNWFEELPDRWQQQLAAEVISQHLSQATPLLQELLLKSQVLEKIKLLKHVRIDLSCELPKLQPGNKFFMPFSKTVFNLSCNFTEKRFMLRAVHWKKALVL